MDDDSRVIDKGWDAPPEYRDRSGDADDAVTVSISTTPGEWLVNTVDSVVVPMSMAELIEALQRRQLTERSLVWRAGMQEWSPVDKVPQLKLAARMSNNVGLPRPAPASSSAPAAGLTHLKPPPKPAYRTTPAPPAPQSTPPQSLPSRKSTLPFGLPTPTAAQSSRPANPRPSSSPRAAEPPPPFSEEPEVLAVYARPAATISFDLSPEQPLRAATPAVPPPPHTLAPTTTDSAPRRMPTPRQADLSVVAASQFRQVQRSSKRLIWISSLASAAAASLLTFWVARGAGYGASSAARPTQVAAPAIAIAQALPSPPAQPIMTANVTAPATTASAALSAQALASVKPKAPTHKAKAVSVAVAPRPQAAAADDAHVALKDPSGEPNPYDVKLDEDPPAAKSAAVAAHGSGLEANSKDSEASTASGSESPGF
jgi:hypothetical protein